MKRWLVLTLGLGIAAIAGASLLTSGDSESHIGGMPELPATSSPPLHDEIDRESRDRLRAILRQADAEGTDAP